jgi:hypothetical protein
MKNGNVISIPPGVSFVFLFLENVHGNSWMKIRCSQIHCGEKVRIGADDWCVYMQNLS